MILCRSLRISGQLLAR